MAKSQRGGESARPSRAILKQAVYLDDTGRMWKVLVPEGEKRLERGIVLGPPDTRPLDLPEETDVRLNNQLHNRGLITEADIRRRPKEVMAALQAALRVSTTAVMNLYINKEGTDGQQ